MAADPRSPVVAPAIAPEPSTGPTQRRPGRIAEPEDALGVSGIGDASGASQPACPYLRSADGTHRSSTASREHRCWAEGPPYVVATTTQGEVCLVAAHIRCERYVGARERRAAGLATDHVPDHLVVNPRFAIPVDTVPVVVDSRPGGRDPAGSPLANGGRDRRRVGAVAAAIAALVVGGIGLVVLAGGIGGQPRPTAPLAAMVATSPPSGQGAVAPDPTKGPASAATPAPTPDGTLPAATDAGTVLPQADPTRTPGPSYPVAIRRTYLVKEGDTYRSLARRFGLKPRDLRALNGPLKVGERILIPAEPWVTDAPDA